MYDREFVAWQIGYEASMRTVPRWRVYFGDQFSQDIGGQISAVIIVGVPILIISFILRILGAEQSGG